MEDLKDDDHELVMATTNRLISVAQLLGQARTRNELIPFLLEYVEQDSDEAHTAIAKHLGDFTDVRTNIHSGEEEMIAAAREQQQTIVHG